jgi:hypothetical protein
MGTMTRLLTDERTMARLRQGDPAKYRHIQQTLATAAERRKADTAAGDLAAKKWMKPARYARLTGTGESVKPTTTAPSQPAQTATAALAPTSARRTRKKRRTVGRVGDLIPATSTRSLLG